jgi:uncharacterized protein YbjT (DUF2867 family)
MTKPKVLVFLGTSRQGAAVVDALLASDKFEVYATTRSAKSAEALKARGVKCGPFTCGDAASAKAALAAAEPSLVFFTTLMGSRDVEGSAGKIIVDAIKEKGGVQHVVYSSVANADVAPDAVGHFKSKLDVEDGVEIKILRRVRAESSRRPPRHRRDACSMAWRCRFITTRRSQHGRVIAVK